MTICISESPFKDPIDLVTKTPIMMDVTVNELVGMTETIIRTPSDIYKIGSILEKERTTTATKFNATSSRSHCLMWIKVYTKLEPNKVRINHLKMLDLAGSERVGQ
jgi:hypothetical protein